VIWRGGPKNDPAGLLWPLGTPQRCDPQRGHARRQGRAQGHNRQPARPKRRADLGATGAFDPVAHRRTGHPVRRAKQEGKALAVIRDMKSQQDIRATRIALGACAAGQKHHGRKRHETGAQHGKTSLKTVGKMTLCNQLAINPPRLLVRFPPPLPRIA
jgi:hypothetical protein